MKHQFIFRTMLWLMVLLTSLSSYAQKMVGDGFGGRAGYNPVNLVTGRDNSGIICADKTLYIWGVTDYSLNNGTFPNTSTPTQANISNVRQVAMSNGRYTYIKDDGTGYVFGQPTPYNNSLLSDAYHTDVAGSIGFVFAKTDGTVWYGGSSLVSGVAAPCPSINNQPTTYCVTQVPGLSNIKRVAMASNCINIVALAADGTVKTIYGNFGGNYPASLKSNTAITIPSLSNIVDVKANHGNYYALTSSGQVYAWGVALGMGTGLPLSTTQYEPQLITFPAGAAPIKAIIPSRHSQSCFAIDENGVCYVWGAKFNDAVVNYYSTPQVIATNVRDVVAGENYSYYYKNDNTLWGLGFREVRMFNQSANGAYFTTPTQLTIPSTLCAIQSFTGMPPCTVNNITPLINKN